MGDAGGDKGSEQQDATRSVPGEDGRAAEPPGSVLGQTKTCCRLCRHRTAAAPGPWGGTAGQTPASSGSERGLRTGRTLPARPLGAVGARVSLLHPWGGRRAPGTRPERTPAAGGWSQEKVEDVSGSRRPRTACPASAKDSPAVPRSLPPDLPNGDTGTGGRVPHPEPTAPCVEAVAGPGSAPTRLRDGSSQCSATTGVPAPRPAEPGPRGGSGFGGAVVGP